MKYEKILIIVDMQNDFIDGTLGTKEAEKMIPNAVEKIKNFSGKLIATMDTHTEDYLNTQEGKNLPVKHCIKGTNGWEMNSDIKTAIGERDCIFLEKQGFGSPELGDEIRKVSDDNTEVELIGLCTDICVISNAMLLKSYFPEMKLFVDESCCAGVTKESHNNALEAMKMCQISIVGGKQ